MNYVARAGITPLMDNGHYHPTEVVSDKVSSMLLFNDHLALHITRPVRWDSDHVVLYDDETREIAKEIVRADALDKVFIATDYFDASIKQNICMDNRNEKCSESSFVCIIRARITSQSSERRKVHRTYGSTGRIKDYAIWRYMAGIS